MSMKRDKSQQSFFLIWRRNTDRKGYGKKLKLKMEAIRIVQMEYWESNLNLMKSYLNQKVVTKVSSKFE